MKTTEQIKQEKQKLYNDYDIYEMLDNEKQY